VYLLTLNFQKEIKGAMGITTYEFENLYAWYSWPNVVLPIIGGYFVDNVLGMRIAAFVFAAFILLGKST
jgi:dipeptide/tripeptide permease